MFEKKNRSQELGRVPSIRHPAQLPQLSTDRGFTGRPQPTDRGITGQPTLSTRGITVMPRGGPGRAVTGDYVMIT